MRKDRVFGETSRETAKHIARLEVRSWRFYGGVDGIEFVSETGGKIKETRLLAYLFLQRCWR
jgi:hypothetical protein